MQIADLSQHNGKVNWTQVQASPPEGVILRVGYRGYGFMGTLQEDVRFRENAAGANAAGIPMGVYFFTQAVTEAEAREEADFALNLAQNYSLTLPVFVDSEYGNAAATGRADRLSKAVRTANLLAFCDRVRERGYTPGIYASESWYKGFLDVSALNNVTLWVAKYAAGAPNIGRPYDGWQYTDQGSLPGVSGAVDLSRFTLAEPEQPANALKTIPVQVGEASLTGLLVQNTTYVPLRTFLDTLKEQLQVRWQKETGVSVVLDASQRGT